MKRLLIIPLLLAFLQLTAQIGIGTVTPAPSAAIDISDTSRGLLIPRMSMKQRTRIVNPAEGLLLYQRDSLKGYWYFDGQQWQNLSSLKNGGKQTIVIADDISDQEAQVKFAAEFGPNTQAIKIAFCNNLTTIDLSAVNTAIDIRISDNAFLKSVYLQNLTRCDGDFEVYECPQLSTINLASLTKTIGRTSFENTGLTSLNLAALTKLVDFTLSDNKSLSSLILPMAKSAGTLSIYDNPVLSSISFPLMTAVSYLNIQNCDLLSSMSFPLLSTLGSMSFTNNKLIPVISMPSLTAITSNQSFVNISDCDNLAALTFNNLITYKCSYLNVTHNKLPSVQVNYLLSKFVAISPALTGVTFDFSQNAPVAPPTGQGIADKLTLIARGNVVTTD